MADLQNNSSLWKSSFVTLLVVNLLTGIAMYGLLLTEPWVIGRYFQENLSVAGAVVSVFGAGIFLFGPFANYWLDRYKRKSVVLWAQFFMLLFTVATLYRLPEWIYIAARFIQGSAYGLFQIALGSTLLIDLTYTKKRTEAAYWYYWFTRLALALGPMAALLLNFFFDWENVIWLPASLLLLSWLLILQLHVPFRTPLEPKCFSLDRFWLSRGKILFFTLVPVSFLLGLLLPRNYTVYFYGWLFLGFLLSQAVHYFFFRKRDSRMLMLLGFLSLVLVYVFNVLVPEPDVVPFTGLFAGVGGGLLTSRYLIYFMRVAEHCERGTAQSSFMLGWESGLCLGVLCSSVLLPQNAQIVYLVGLIVVLLLAVFYFTKVHHWFLMHSRKGM